MPLLLRKRVAFLHIPKTGGTTLERILIDQFPDDFCFLDTHGFGPLRPNMRSAAMLEMKSRADAAKISEFPSFQHWTYAEIKRLVPNLDTWWSFAFVRSPWARLYSEHRYLSRILKRCDLPFGEWARLALNQFEESPMIYDNHLRAQVEFVGPNTEVYRFEQLAAGIAQIASRLGFTAYTLAEHFKSGDSHDFRSAYTRSLIDLVSHHYREDIDRFGYAFD